MVIGRAAAFAVAASRLMALTMALVLAAAPARAGGVSIEGLLQLWYTQASNHDLRRGRTNVPPNAYYDLRSEFTKDSFHVRRTEIKLTAEVAGRVSVVVMVDPAMGQRSSNLLQDAIFILKPTARIEVRIGQMKTLQTHEGLASSGDLFFAERGQLTRLLGDVRDRGVSVSHAFGDPNRAPVKVFLAVFNGAGRIADVNAQKDRVARIQLRPGPSHEIGVYGLLGASDQPDGDDRVALTLAGERAPGPRVVLENEDRTTNLGAYYVLRRGGFEAALEATRGRLGRRRPTLGTSAGPARREHLDQRFLGMQATAAYGHGPHTAAFRYDRFDANAGHDRYAAQDPYTQLAPGARRGADYTPCFTELLASYTYAFDPLGPGTAKIQFTYVRRSRNFLLPPPGEVGLRGGDSLVVLFQAAF